MCNPNFERVKKSRYIFLSSFLLVLLNVVSYGQQTEIDSLENLFKTAKDDSTKTYLLYEIGEVYHYQEDFPQGLEYYSRGLKLAEEIGNLETAAKILRNIGRIYYAQGDYSTSIEYYIRALDIYDNNKIENHHLGWLLHYIGSVYKQQGNYVKACEFYQKVLDLANKLKDDYLKADALLLLANCARHLDNDDKALALDIESLHIFKKLNAKSSIAVQCTNVAFDYESLGEYHKALEYYLLGLHYLKELRDTSFIAATLCDLANLYCTKKEYSRAFTYLEEAKAYLPHVKNKRHLRYQYYYRCSYKVYKSIGDFENALKFHLLYTSIKDSVLNEESIKQVAEMETKYETEKAERENEIFRQEKEIRLLKEKEAQELMKRKAQQQSRRDNLQYSGILIFLVLVFTGIFMLGKFSIPIRLAEGLIFFSFLLFFEFTLVLLDPYIEQYSSGAPAVKLGFNAVLAGLIFPLHQMFEAKLKQRITNRSDKN